MTSLDSTPTLAPDSLQIRIVASPDSSPLFSIQDALLTYGDFQNAKFLGGGLYRTPGTLFRSGCVVDGILNCTAACQDVNQIFADPHTFQNCMVVASLPDSIVTLPAGSTAVAREFFIPIDQTEVQSLASVVRQKIQDCVVQYFGNSSGGDILWEPWYQWLDVPTGTPSFPSICDKPIAVPLNADVGGIGVRKATSFLEDNAYPWQVYISYWLQGGISLSAFLALKICDKFPYETRLRKFLPPLKSATVEFHKAQCFFMLAIDIATQIVMQTGTLNDGSAKLQGLYNNYVLIGTISLSGLLPITFMLLALHSLGVRSWYLLILSSCTVALSAATLFTTGSFKPSPADLMRLRNEVSGRFSACGLKDPSNYCLQTNRVTLTSMHIGQGSIGGPILVFTLIILALIFLDYCRAQDTAMYKWIIQGGLKRLKSVSEAVQQPRDAQGHLYCNQRLENVRDYALHCLYFITWHIYLIFWAYYLRSLVVGTSAGIVPTWTFGQIVAISVWAQPLFEYVKLSVRKLPTFI